MKMEYIKNRKQQCHVPQCPRTPNCSLHSLPANTDRRKFIRQQWIEALNIDPNVTDALILVCSLHFTAEDYAQDVQGKRSRLKKTAVPSRNLPNYQENNSLEDESFKTAENDNASSLFTIQLVDDLDEFDQEGNDLGSSELNEEKKI